MKNRSAQMPKAFGLIMLIAFMSETAFSADSPNPPWPDYLYKTTFVRAAPGKLLDLIALWKNRLPVYDAAEDERPLWWRHTQGDHWDLMLLFPMGSYAEYYAKERVSRREKAGLSAAVSPGEFRQKLEACSSWTEDIFVLGPPLDSVKKDFRDSAYYHIEIFVSLPGKQAELYQEREMENAYQVGIGRPYNWIFVRDQGTVWDMYTLGCYRDLQHWAASSGLPKEKRDEVARRAGFADADAIGPYLRTLIDLHRDTMGVAIK